MNKKQVGALLKVMSKDTTRPAMCAGYVDSYEGKTVLVATDGYAMAIVNMEGAKELEGKLIRREAIEKWYKLATSKSRLTGEELVHVSADDYAQHGEYSRYNYVPWKDILPRGETQPQASMKFNAEYFKTMQDIEGVPATRVELYGALKPMVMRGELGTYIVMPMK